MQTIEVRDGYYVQYDEDGELMGVRIDTTDGRTPCTTSVPAKEALVIHEEPPQTTVVYAQVADLYPPYRPAIPVEVVPGGETEEGAATGYPCPVCGKMFELSEDNDSKSTCGHCGMVYTGDANEATGSIAPVLTDADCAALRASRCGKITIP